jgi:CHAT domain-containing protein/tetratricopeptide (TPR) repeat protein
VNRKRFGIVARLQTAFAAMLMVLPPGQLSDSHSPQGEAGETLRTGQSIAGEIAGRERHRYRVHLRSGDYAAVRVEQRGIDLTIAVYGVDRELIADFQADPRPYGREDVELVATADGEYELTVTAIGPLGKRAPYDIALVSTRPAVDGDRSAQEWRHLRTLGGQLLETGQLPPARPLLDRSLALAERGRGNDDVEVAAILNQLASAFEDGTDFRRAEELHMRALVILERANGPDDPSVATTLSRLAFVYQHNGKLPAAERAISRALDLLETTIDTGHPMFASALVNASNVRLERGDFEKAEEFDRRALAILENAGETGSILYASTLNNLGLSFMDRMDFTTAQQYFERAIEIGERLRGRDSYWSANTLQNLGIVARQRKDYATAEQYQLRVLAIRKNMVGPEHGDVAATLNNLALIYRDKGDIPRALETMTEALRVFEAAQGPYAGGTLIAVGNLARMYAAQRDFTNAIVFQRRADAIVEVQIALNLAVGSERQKLALVNSSVDRTDRTISLHLNLAPDDEDAAALAGLVVLQRKGRVLDAMTDTFEAVRRRADAPEERALLDQLRTTTAELASVALNPPSDLSGSERRRSIGELERRKEKLEAQMSDRNAEFRLRTQPVTVDSVDAAVPRDTALVEFKVFRPFDPKNSRNSEAYGPRHYAAYVFRHGGPPRGRDLGAADAIDRSVEAFRQALRDPARADVKRLARALDRQVFEPVRSLVGDATRLLLSPDGELNLIPFEALVDETSRFGIERYAISYLTSGRDLLRVQAPRLAQSSPIVVADPTFGEPRDSQGAGAVRQGVKAARRSITIGPNMSAMYFAPLDGTSAEARVIKSLFPDARVLIHQQATKTALGKIDAPRLLHIATHGFFIEDTQTKIENPLLRSGLALTGANLRADNTGILTALEAANLNLWGTQLVTLSACDTGIGEVKTGEGVYGLRRAFLLAGAESLVMSLWPVNDVVTREMMTAYYRGLKSGLGREDALREAQRAMLARSSRRHPFYWASFILAGDWTPLDAPR